MAEHHVYHELERVVAFYRNGSVFPMHPGAWQPDAQEPPRRAALPLRWKLCQPTRMNPLSEYGAESPG
jgi:hypothetical protein